MSQKIRISIFLAAAIIMAFILFYIVFFASENNYFLLEQEQKQKRDTIKEIETETMQKETDKTEKIQEIEQETIQNDLNNTKEVESIEEVKNIQKICVFVCGKVKKAGTYELLEGARLSDFIHAAGGFSKHAAKEYLNLAEKAEDGQKVYVPSKKEAKKWKRESRNSSIRNDSNSQENQNNQDNLKKQVSENKKVNINTAGKEELMTLSGIGEAKADAILAYREEQGAFHTIEELMQISGIKEGIYNKLCNDITI